MNRKLKEFVNHNARLKARFDAMGPRHVAILLAHYNAGDMLDEQLQSLNAQTHRDWSLIISDDGSSDDWCERVAAFAALAPTCRIQLAIGPQRGYAANFLSLTALAGPMVPYAAFCDHDDVWLPDKLDRALAALGDVPKGQPALYCGRTVICDRELQPIARSPLFAKPPSFGNALVQNIGGGNTMVLNRAALDLLQDTVRHAQGIVSHDWWAYQIVSGAGGAVIYDRKPSVLYRQHQGNSIGANLSWSSRVQRLRLLLAGRFRTWNAANIAALERSRHWLTPEARAALDSFAIARTGWLWNRVRALHRSGVYRQTAFGQLALWLAMALDRL